MSPSSEKCGESDEPPLPDLLDAFGDLSRRVLHRRIRSHSEEIKAMSEITFFVLGYAAALISMAIIFVALCIRAPTREDL